MIADRLRAYSETTDAALLAYLAKATGPSLLKESMAYSLFAGGKRLRPALCLSACELLGGHAGNALPAACALEMIHTYSLIHDDLPAMDNDDMRRGKPSNHVRFGEGNAILAGDGLLSLAFLTLSDLDRPEAARVIACGAYDMVAGQSLDLNAAETSDLETIHRYKTGALISAAVLSGAYCADPSTEDIHRLSAFADSYGLLFQITDDILDVEGSAAELGKSVGKDERAEKLTFVTRDGIDGARRAARNAAARAAEALSAYGADAIFFTELIDFTLTRRA